LLTERAKFLVQRRLALRAVQHRAEDMISETQDLVVVGAGIAGLAAAYFYKRRFLNATYWSWNETDSGAAACSGELEGDSRPLR
jgi:predicted NAD/FAD-binding protein